MCILERHAGTLVDQPISPDRHFPVCRFAV